MPYRRRTNYRRRRPMRRRRAPRRFRRRRYQRVPRVSLLGNRKVVKFKYHDVTNLQAGIAGQPGSHIFSANGLFDPNITATGHQPRGFDELMALYHHYVVVGSQCVVTFLQTADVQGIADTLSQNVGICLRPNSTPLPDQADLLEDRNVSFRALASFQSGGPVTVTRKFSTKKFLGRASVLSDPELKGSASANPAEQGYFQVFAAPVGISQSAGNVQASVNITYLVVLIEPRLPLAS